MRSAREARFLGSIFLSFFLKYLPNGLRGTRCLPNRPAKRQQEPVDFGNTRHRLLWARLRTLIADGHQAVGEYDAAERAYAWSARAVAVRTGTVLWESEWVTELSAAERQVAKRALLGLAATKTKRGEKDAGEAIGRWAEKFQSLEDIYHEAHEEKK